MTHYRAMKNRHSKYVKKELYKTRKCIDCGKPVLGYRRCTLCLYKLKRWNPYKLFDKPSHLVIPPKELLNKTKLSESIKDDGRSLDNLENNIISFP